MSELEFDLLLLNSRGVYALDHGVTYLSYAMVKGGASSLETGRADRSSSQLHLLCDLGKATLTSSFFLLAFVDIHVTFRRIWSLFNFIFT